MNRTVESQGAAPEPTGVFPIEIDPQSKPVGANDMLDGTASVAIVLLAAGKASRMGEGGAHKLLAEFDGIPLVRRSALAALGADAATVVAVTGHRRPLELLPVLALRPGIERDDPEVTVPTVLVPGDGAIVGETTFQDWVTAQ